MKTIEYKSTKSGKFVINLPKGFKKVKLPFYQKWIDALEGGKYRQCVGTLCETNNKKLTYCCLGVLSKVQGRLKKDENNEMVDHSDGYTGDLNSNNPSFKALKGRGEFPTGVCVQKNDHTNSVYDLVECNDDLRLSFKDIAKIIKTIFKK